jgi:hypothetical protein
VSGAKPVAGWWEMYQATDRSSPDYCERARRDEHDDQLVLTVEEDDDAENT